MSVQYSDFDCFGNPFPPSSIRLWFKPFFRTSQKIQDLLATVRLLPEARRSCVGQLLLQHCLNHAAEGVRPKFCMPQICMLWGCHSPRHADPGWDSFSCSIV